MGIVFEEANPEQREAIETIDGPLLIVAGPGTGKTHTLVLRIVNLVVNHEVPLSRIFLATFTNKAANEFTKRLATALGEHGVRPNFDEAYIGTFHSICERILRENPDVSGLQRNFATKDQFDQEYFVHSHLKDFETVPRFRDYFDGESLWEDAVRLCRYVNNLQEELVSEDVLLESGDSDAEFFGNLLKRYRELREENNFLDFTLMQTAVYRMMQDPGVRERIAGKFDYVLIDEYQDTNHVQEQLTLLLGSNHNNICVVGDEDQAIYRFRGATVRNILEFKDHFPECRQVVLTGNYRSHPGIVEFYNRWMTTTSVPGINFSWDRYRNPKTINAVGDVKGDYDPVSICGGKDLRNLCENAYLTIKSMRDAGKVKDYNQIAFLFTSVKSATAHALEDYLRDQGISVFSPRSGRFFERNEVKTAIGLLLSLFPSAEGMIGKLFYADLRGYYTECLHIAAIMVTSDPKLELWRDSVRTKVKYGEKIPLTFSDLLYRLFAFKPLKAYLDRAVGGDLILQRPARNLALLVKYVRKYEANENMRGIDPANLESKLKGLFMFYFLRLYKTGVFEYEDDEVYSPSGHVCFFTIHQAKGLEFPVVFVGLPHRGPDSVDPGESFTMVIDSYSDRMTFEPPEIRPYADYWRVMYVAFSRAESQLVLLRDAGYAPHKCFGPVTEGLPVSVNPTSLNLKPMGSHSVMRSYAFTTDVGAYGRCQVHYCLHRVLGFEENDLVGMAFGSIVHGILESVNKAVLSEGPSAITEEKVEEWCVESYNAVKRASRHIPLNGKHLGAAVRQVNGYIRSMEGRWDTLYASEMPVSVIHGDYIVEGRVDLILKIPEGCVVVDYKTGSKPDPKEDPEAYGRVRDQLTVYAYLLEERYGMDVAGMRAYYTGADDPYIDFPFDPGAVEDTMERFDDVVSRIQDGEFRVRSMSEQECRGCEFRFYCGRGEPE